MHRSSVLVVVLTSAFVAAAATTPTGRASARERHRAAESARLRAHFDSVDLELRARDVAALSASQRAARARLVGWLRDYRDGGRFPENDRLPVAAPFFRDARGNLCAMAYLIDRSGRRDIVDDVARSRNNAYIRELVDDPRLVAWLDSVGLSAGEAARIQPTYGPPDDGMPGEASVNVSAQDAAVAGVLIASSLVMTGIDIAAPTRGRGWLGVGVGAGAVAFGLVKWDDGKNYRDLSRVTSIAGGAAIVAGAWAIVRDRPRAHADRALAVAPGLVDDGRRARPGLVARLTF